ncbi:preprotein translocase subunit SecE [Mergibacter septicus]|uniref:Protein translocase subunit SecE n=1 Tax=Mergibacter septicus TaxID=221402 RepID=A0A8E3MF29_9PAST|nr:preprotein translocase subunit SecE [Mergibacter septicus]AWX14874.1 preprotein translocase subunit SecE [Mergibacter septicus]QDJ14126.1 preprotein translocase subunit SecE [Mergibacter septicus]UTU48424.1 preprotein translocase subunit SecE [Mergibacter septicus]WMR95947.1 preprotein translocase subunit SecE [Mergibacter septicus]
MSTEVDKKKISHESASESKGKNGLLWFLSLVLIAVSAVGNLYYADRFSIAIRIVGVVVLLAIALLLLAFTTQGTKARVFLKESRIELRKIIWPARSEATQTTFIVMGVTVVTSLILWGLDSIIVSLINFITSLRF